VRAAAALLLLGAVLLAGCGPVQEDDGAREEGPLRVVATTGMIGDAVRQLAGDLVELETLMGPGVDPHLYRATEGDVRRLGEADLVLLNGLHLEAKLADVLERLGDRTVAVADAVPEARRLAPPEFEGQYDPHIWFDVELWSRAVEQIRDALVARDPENERAYRANARRYLAELLELDDWVAGEAERVPDERRVLVTAHDAFNYFGRAYGFDVRGLQGISTATEAGAGDIQRLAAFIAERKLPAIFVESSVAPRSIEAVQAAVRARGWDVEIGGSLYSDALGDPDTPEGTYVGMVRHNVETIVAGLLGEDAR
jgi:manganese/zinc/iron transport system substrate-binding protein